MSRDGWPIKKLFATREEFDRFQEQQWSEFSKKHPPLKALFPVVEETRNREKTHGQISGSKSHPPQEVQIKTEMKKEMKREETRKEIKKEEVKREPTMNLIDAVEYTP